MFSKKYQEELFEKKYNSMKQMDRIELQNREIIYQNNNNRNSTFYILTFISWFFCLSIMTNYMYLLQLGINSIAHLELGRVFAIMGLVFFVLYISEIFTYCRNKYNNIKSREKFLEEHIK